jgi:GntR family transcriptional regulator/MocR family aminotransferase
LPPRPRPARERAFFDVPALAAESMSTGTATAAGAADGRPVGPGFRAICATLRREILDGALKPGARVPSTRALAATLGVARMTVVTAYEQLRAEGYLEGRVGSGTRVTATLPALGPRRGRAPVRPASVQGRGGPARAASVPAAPQPPLAARATDYAAFATDPAAEVACFGRPVTAFRPGVPALDAFPIRQWASLASRCYRLGGRALLASADPRGYRPLREAIAAYLGASRGVRCDAEQVIVVAGAQQGLHLAARVCLAPGDAAWVEEPGYPSARRALADAGARLVPVPVDAEGLDVAAGRRRAPEARLAFVTPAHQAPLGVVMSVGRRLALLAWARERGAWVLEDDYDGEFRYAGHPLPALQGLDDGAQGAAGGRVLYLGTFSKTLYPSIRMGYLVVPPALVDAVAGARAVADRYSPVAEQAVVAEFMARGWFARHVRRMRTLYAERQAALLDAAGRELVGTLRLAPDPGGLQLLGWLPPGVDADAACRAARRAGVESPVGRRVLRGAARGRGPGADARLRGRGRRRHAARRAPARAGAAAAPRAPGAGRQGAARRAGGLAAGAASGAPAAAPRRAHCHSRVTDATALPRPDVVFTTRAPGGAGGAPSDA